MKFPLFHIARFYCPFSLSPLPPFFWNAPLENPDIFLVIGSSVTGSQLEFRSSVYVC